MVGFASVLEAQLNLLAAKGVVSMQKLEAARMGQSRDGDFSQLQEIKAMSWNEIYGQREQRFRNSGGEFGNSTVWWDTGTDSTSYVGSVLLEALRCCKCGRMFSVMMWEKFKFCGPAGAYICDECYQEQLSYADAIDPAPEKSVERQQRRRESGEAAATPVRLGDRAFDLTDY